ncbi:MAG: Xaa-Pro peptidase family protein [Candidatus Saelkia tenebricola]|nr:Xaa-Pro peptidase family protein [Candidatus Saelkia tenebricola]
MSLNLTRINKLRREMFREKVDFSLFITPENLFYFLGSNIEGFLLIPQGNCKCTFITDARYGLELQNLENRNLKTCVWKKSWLDELTKTFNSTGRKKTVSLEQDLPLRLYFKIQKKINNVRLKVLPLTERLRMIKDTREIENIRKAVGITKKTLRIIRSNILSKTELNIQAMLEFEFRKRGGYGVAFPSIVASGVKSSFPHAVPNEHIFRKKDGFILIDCGAKFNGYCADLTRMYFWDRIPKVIKDAYRLIQEAQKLAVSLVSDGVRVSRLVLEVEGFIEKNGFKNNIAHGLGHGVGINVHEGPVLSRSSKEILKKGMVITIEPGLYFPGIGGVRIEDVVLVDKNKGIVL